MDDAKTEIDILKNKSVVCKERFDKLVREGFEDEGKRLSEELRKYLRTL